MVKVTQKNFDLFLSNQEKFAEALNHRMTKVEKSVSCIPQIKTEITWIKKAVYGIIGIFTTIGIAIFIALITKGI